MQKTSKLLSFQKFRDGQQNCLEQKFTKSDRESTSNKYDCSSEGESHSGEVKVVLGESTSATFRQCRRAFYSKKYYPTEIESLLVRPLAQAIKVYNATSPVVRAIPHGHNINCNHNNTKNTRVKTRVYRYRNKDNNIQENSGTRQATTKHIEVTSDDNNIEGRTDTAFIRISSNVHKDMVTDADNPSTVMSKPHIASNENGHFSTKSP